MLSRPPAGKPTPRRDNQVKRKKTRKKPKEQAAFLFDRIVRYFKTAELVSR